MPVIRVADLGKTFAPASRRAAAVAAVRDLSFAVEPGERVAFIGPNGAGKSTTLKMLTGILTPSTGAAEVAGLVPWRERTRLAHRIGIVFGQRSQLWYHLKVRDSFALLGRIYDLPRATLAARCDRLVERFAIADLIERPVATLSLGQRLRCELVASLLHAPAVVFLDEPTIGLDVTAKAALRDHLNALAREDGTTVLLTSHDTGDIEQVCERAIVIDRGTVLLDAPLDRLRRQFLDRREIVLVTDEEHPALDLPGIAVHARTPHRLAFSVDPAATPVESVVASALARLSVRDITIENPPLEQVIAAIYRRTRAGAP